VHSAASFLAAKSEKGTNLSNPPKISSEIFPVVNQMRRKIFERRWDGMGSQSRARIINMFTSSRGSAWN